jgi:hypothetical protein
LTGTQAQNALAVTAAVPGTPWLGQEQRISFGSEDLVAFEEGHSKEIGDFTGAAEAEFFVEAHRARERCRGVECNSRAILAAKFSFSVGE